MASFVRDSIKVEVTAGAEEDVQRSVGVWLRLVCSTGDTRTVWRRAEADSASLGERRITSTQADKTNIFQHFFFFLHFRVWTASPTPENRQKHTLKAVERNKLWEASQFNCRPWTGWRCSVSIDQVALISPQGRHAHVPSWTQAVCYSPGMRTK